MKASDVKAQIEKLEREIVNLKAEIHDRLEAIKHLTAVHDVLAEEEKK